MEDLRALVRFLPDLRRSDFSAGSWGVSGKASDGTITLPHASLGDTAEAFVAAASLNEWVRRDFNGAEWAQTAEARQLRDDEPALASATADQLARLLTVCIRQNRFVDGALPGAFESGLILRVVRRAAALLRKEE